MRPEHNTGTCLACVAAWLHEEAAHVAAAYAITGAGAVDEEDWSDTPKASMLYDIEKLFSELDDENQDLSFKSQQISDKWTAAVDAAKEADDVGPIIS